MGGADTIRGINFQHLCAILKALQMVEDPNGGCIVIEGKENIIDIGISDRNGNTTSITQAKSRIEPYVWTDSELVNIIREWHKLKHENIMSTFSLLMVR